MSRPPFIPPGLWPPRMPADMAAGYCGERSVETFLAAVRRGEYPQPRIKHGRRRIWMKRRDFHALRPEPHRPRRRWIRRTKTSWT